MFCDTICLPLKLITNNCTINLLDKAIVNGIVLWITMSKNKKGSILQQDNPAEGSKNLFPHEKMHTYAYAHSI